MSEDLPKEALKTVLEALCAPAISPNGIDLQADRWREEALKAALPALLARTSAKQSRATPRSPPQPGLADLAALLETGPGRGPHRHPGTGGDLTGPAPGIQLAVYRIVQEALTNTLKHAAPDTTVHVTVAADRDRVCLTVDDTGPPRTPHADGAQDDVRGLVGMRERGGWTVRAHLIPTTAPTENHPA
ncbi:ATP-binding protein [Streptomyces sp. NPDC007095]|uniref:sensor histidine kinase n=1 Tax=Streptomyces sp. NPDC007095 TaxID=3154482 RepID=UPI0034112F9E